MPVFFFDVYDDLSGPDQVGMNCTDSEAAAREAVELGKRLLAAEADWFGTGQRWQIGVADATGAPIFLLDFCSATELTDQARDGAAVIMTAKASPVLRCQLARRRVAFA